MEFHVIELPKLPPELKDNNDTDKVYLWAKFISSEKKEEFDMVAEKDPYIESAYKQLQIISQDKQKRLEYEAREKAMRDYNQGIFEAEQRGEKRGEQRGKQEEAIIIAKNMKKEHFSNDTISKLTGLSVTEINTL